MNYLSHFKYVAPSTYIERFMDQFDLQYIDHNDFPVFTMTCFISPSIASTSPVTIHPFKLYRIRNTQSSQRKNNDSTRTSDRIDMKKMVAGSCFTEGGVLSLTHLYCM